MLNEESEKKEASFENVPSLMTPELPEPETKDVAAAASSEEENVDTYSVLSGMLIRSLWAGILITRSQQNCLLTSGFIRD